MRQSVTKQLFAYWNRLKEARSAPERSEIDPAEIREALADSFILEVDSTGRFPIRLCGTRLEALWLCEQKGKSFLDLWREDDRKALSSVMLTVVDGVAPVVAGAEGTAGDSLEPLDLELLLLPLRHFGKTHARVLGALTPSHQPRWLGLAPSGPLRLKSFRVVAGAENRSAKFGAAAFHPHIAAGRPQLVLYRGGKA